MTTREDIINRCRNSITHRYDKPDLSDLDVKTPDDVLATFQTQAELAGCKVVEAASLEEIDEIISTIYPDAKVIASALPEVKSATLNPDTIPDARDLNGTDVGVIRARFGVGENGGIWVPQQVRERDICFISENLVAVLDRKAIVPNFHEAYKLIGRNEYGADDFNSYGYGVFIAGPSKTADIAQVLVMGAQAARSMTIILV
ncbi:MAG: LUD domain-containing protein [Clostridium sp.]|nr:LUD domain-containing protein [Prevotella sp.]MCM1429674.1 LUD domain-containing protein [Clostridium sp.]MCM1476171.1 LUD domain-containing protein [Muribaculaceae bacterium]